VQSGFVQYSSTQNKNYMINVQNSVISILRKVEIINSKIASNNSLNRQQEKQIKNILARANSTNESECELMLISILQRSEKCLVETKKLGQEKRALKIQIKSIV